MREPRRRILRPDQPATEAGPRAVDRPEFMVYQLADISTLYLPRSDLPLLMRSDCPTRVGEVDGQYGTFHWVPMGGSEVEALQIEAKEFGLSDHFLRIMALLCEQRIPYCRFDGDGKSVLGLDIHPDYKDDKFE